MRKWSRPCVSVLPLVQLDSDANAIRRARIATNAVVN